MKVGEICSRDVRTIDKHVPLLEAARRMREEHVGDLIVVEEHHARRLPIGVLTDRDIVVGVLARDLEHLRTLDVGDVIGADPVVTASDEELLASALRRMRSFGVRRLPVVDASGALVGVLAADDVIAALSDELAEIAALLAKQPRMEADRRH